MSYILDALKKSEEERHQGQLPNLGSNSTLIHNAKTKSSFWPWVIAFLLILNILFLVFWVLKEPSDSYLHIQSPATIHFTQQEAEQVDSEQPVVAKLTSKQPITEAVIVNKQEDHRLVAAHSTTTYELPTVSEPIGDALYESKAALSNNKVVIQQGSEPELVVPGGGYPSKMVAEAEVVETEIEAPLLITPKGKSRPYTGPAYIPQAVESENTRDVTELDPQRVGDPKSARPAIDDTAAILRLTDKPHSFQIKIPDMAFNSHIYTDTASSRRVMINNIYLREGQTFSGMKVEQITEEGIILSLNNELFKMGVLRDWYSPR